MTKKPFSEIKNKNLRIAKKQVNASEIKKQKKTHHNKLIIKKNPLIIMITKKLIP